MLRIELHCDSFVFINRTIEHYKQAEQVRDLADKLIAMDELIENTPFENLSGCELVLSKWDDDIQWVIGDGKQYPISLELCARGKFWIDLSEIIACDGWIGDQIAVYAIMRWLQKHDEKAKMRGEIASIASSDAVGPLLQVFEKYMPHGHHATCYLRSISSSDFPPRGNDIIAIKLFEAALYTMRYPSPNCEFYPAELECKRSILAKLYPEIDMCFHLVIDD